MRLLIYTQQKSTHSSLGKDVAEGVVVIGRDDISDSVQQGCHIGMSVVHVGKSIRSDLTGLKVDPVDIAACLVTQVIRVKDDFVVFVQVSDQGYMDRYFGV